MLLSSLLPKDLIIITSRPYGLLPVTRYLKLGERDKNLNYGFYVFMTKSERTNIATWDSIAFLCNVPVYWSLPLAGADLTLTRASHF